MATLSNKKHVPTRKIGCGFSHSLFGYGDIFRNLKLGDETERLG